VVKDDEIYTVRTVYLDWPVEDHRFGYENFKSLESLLAIYPNAAYRFLLPAPREALATNRKLGNLLSALTFSKYRKRGYDVAAVAVGRLDREGQASRVGRDYWSKWVARCCLHCNKRCTHTDRTQPYHVMMFIRLSKLWRLGGIFSDFSFFFLGPLDAPSVTQGWYINRNCSEGPVDHSNSSTSLSDNGGGSGRCFVSTLLVFNTPKSLAVLCVLKKYEDLDFVLCLEHDTDGGGADCLAAAMDRCFASLGLSNDLARPSGLQRLAHDLHQGGAAMLLARAVLRSARGERDDVAAPLEAFHNDPWHAGLTAHSTEWGSDTLSTRTRAFWLGAAAYGPPGHPRLRPWAEGEGEGGAGAGAGEATLLGAAVQTLRLKRHPWEARGCAADSDTNNHGDGGNASAAGGTAWLPPSPLPSPSPSPPPVPPLVVVAGFAQSGAALLTLALAEHPLVLPPLSLDGAGALAQVPSPFCYPI